ncbi:lanthionine synthetase LanC family protein [Nonomuraea solani]|uniref:lanthionine synthetase LanC family protein n=1 Tax=Nonomuraea solani TaxID=1144553 RepID=UPI00135ACEBC|nr:lanthionine synthetase LanC family protein [Nonomuraea solani]
MGLVPLYAALDRRDPGADWHALGHRFLALAARAGATSRAGLFDGGIAGIGAAAASLSGAGHYGGLLGRVDAAVGAVPDHDLVSGTSGAALYLLMRPPSGKRDEVADALAGAGPAFPMRRVPAGWAVGEGYADCGLSHGAAGALAALSLLAAQGTVRADGIRAIADRLLGVARQDEWGTVWPAGVDVRGWHPSPRRASWCYGVPGVARALRLAGEALDEPRYRRAADEAMARLLVAPRVWGLESLGVCHGLAGLLLITAAFAAGEARNGPAGATREAGYDFAAAAEGLFDRLCAAYDGRRPLGFEVEEPGLLSGAAGIALALLAVTGDVPAMSLFLAA